MTATTPAPEFSRPFAVDRLGAAAVTERISATPAERDALARRLGLKELNALSAVFRLERRPVALIHVAGRLEADILQTCVVTLVDFPSHVEDGFEADFGDAPAELGEEISLDLDYDPPEPIEGGAIDLGELVTQYLSLALDPHPRAPGATLDPAMADPDAEARSPFAVLKKLKQPS